MGELYKTKMIEVMSCQEAIRAYPESNTALLRILDSEIAKVHPLIHPDRFSLVEQMTVDDIIPRHLEYEPGLILFESQHFEQLLAFFEKAKQYETVIFHCSAGISRSSAMAILFARYLNRLDLECAICLSHWIRPNQWVMSFEKDLKLPDFPDRLMPLRNKMYKSLTIGDKEAVFRNAIELLKANSN